MPIFSYRCRDCGEQFSTLVMSGETPICRACESEALDKQLSLIAVPAKGGEVIDAFRDCNPREMGACCGGGCELADA